MAGKRRALTVAVALGFSTIALGCGQSIRSDATETGGDAGAETGGTGGAGGAGGSVSGAGGASGSGGSSSSGAPTDDRLLPLEVGRTWTYELAAIDADLPITNCDGALEATVPAKATSGMDTGWEYRPACAGIVVSMFMNGDEIWGYTSSDPSSRFAYAMPPVEEGASWDTGAGLMAVWHDVGTISVPAGTFDRCWRRAWLPDETSFIVLCRGVGLVTSRSAADNFTFELSSKGF